MRRGRAPRHDKLMMLECPPKAAQALIDDVRDLGHGVLGLARKQEEMRRWLESIERELEEVKRELARRMA